MEAIDDLTLKTPTPPFPFPSTTHLLYLSTLYCIIFFLKTLFDQDHHTVSCWLNQFLFFRTKANFITQPENIFIFPLVSPKNIPHSTYHFSHKPLFSILHTQGLVWCGIVKDIATTCQINTPFCIVLSSCFSCTFYSMQLL